uniref:ATP synthase F0 subunit 8 n=1 Tax=Fissurella volcano TaxID=707972 RepID=H6V536_FISVO|nr:ATP synthase F0 subunit 8 [Fissurella volcano]AFB78088.1 ATP synthase F0 subunit 8 [Fissurella volcano]
MPQLGPVNWIFLYLMMWSFVGLLVCMFWWRFAEVYSTKGEGSYDEEGETSGSSNDKGGTGKCGLKEGKSESWSW